MTEQARTVPRVEQFHPRTAHGGEQFPLAGRRRAEDELCHGVTQSGHGRGQFVARTAHRRGQFPVDELCNALHSSRASRLRAEEELCTAVHSFGAVEESP